MSGIEFRVSIFFRPVFGGWPPPIVSMRKHADSSRALGNWVSSDSGADWRRCSVGLCVRLKLKRRRTWRLFVNKEPLNGLRHDADGVGDISIVWHAGYWRIVISMLRGWLSSNDISRKTFTSGDGLGENGTFVLKYWIYFFYINFSNHLDNFPDLTQLVASWQNVQTSTETASLLSVQCTIPLLLTKSFLIQCFTFCFPVSYKENMLWYFSVDYPGNGTQTLWA